MANGESRIIDLRFPGRYTHAEELAKMGMQYHAKDMLLIIEGGQALHGAKVLLLT
jgi:UDP-N-acetylglucosamine 1-carboxyvinyltransferase